MNPPQETFFTDFSDQAHVWIIPLQGTAENLHALLVQLRTLLMQWTSHGRPIQNEAILVFDRFLIVTGEIAGAAISGCGIDTLTHAVEKTAQRHHCRVLSSLLVYYRRLDGTVEAAARSDFQNMIMQGQVLQETGIFDPGIHTLGALRAGKFERPLSDSVYAQIFQIPSTAA